MPRHLLLTFIVLGICISSCGGDASQTPTISPSPEPTLMPISVEQAILTSDDINASNLLKVDGGLEISDSKDCPMEDCRILVWKILDPDSLSIAIARAGLDLVISVRSFQTAEDANSSAAQAYRGGSPGIRIVDISAGILPDNSYILAEDGRLIYLVSVFQKMVISVTISQGQAGLTDLEKAGRIMTNLAKLQIDKIIRLGTQ